MFPVWPSFLIGGDGSVYEGRGWWIWPGLIPRYKKMVNQKQCLFIAYFGRFNGKGLGSKQIT